MEQKTLNKVQAFYNELNRLVENCYVCKEGSFVEGDFTYYIISNDDEANLFGLFADNFDRISTEYPTPCFRTIKKSPNGLLWSEYIDACTQPNEEHKFGSRGYVIDEKGFPTLRVAFRFYSKNLM